MLWLNVAAKRSPLCLSLSVSASVLQKKMTGFKAAAAAALPSKQSEYSQTDLKTNISSAAHPPTQQTSKLKTEQTR